MRLPLSLIALILAGNVAADDYDDIVGRAFDNINRDFKDEWSFTETSHEDEVVIVGRYDPRRPDGGQWALLSVDGREPSAEEIEDYLDDKNGEESAHRDNDEDQSEDGNVVNFETLDLLEETDAHWLFSFIPKDDEDADENEARILRQVNGQLKIVKDGHYVEYIDMHNERPIKPATGVKISRFETRLTFGPATDGGPIVPLSVDVAVKGRAMLLIKFDETESIRFSDYEYVGEAENGAG